MSTYQSLVARELPKQMQEDLSDWKDGQILRASEDEVARLMVEKHGYRTVEFVDDSERQELLVPDEPAAGVRISFQLEPSAGQAIPDFLRLQASTHQSQPDLEVRGAVASFVVKPMGSADQISKMHDAVKANIRKRNQDIRGVADQLEQHARNIYQARRREAEGNQAAAQRAVEEIDRLGIPEAGSAEAGTGNRSDLHPETAEPLGTSSGEESGPTPTDPPPSGSISGALILPGVQQLAPRLDEIRRLVEDLLDRRPDEFTTSICDRILAELDGVTSFVSKFEGDAPPEEIMIPQGLLTSQRVFDWIGGALTGRGFDHLDSLGSELVEAGRVILQTIDLAQNLPV